MTHTCVRNKYINCTNEQTDWRMRHLSDNNWGGGWSETNECTLIVNLITHIKYYNTYALGLHMVLRGALFNHLKKGENMHSEFYTVYHYYYFITFSSHAINAACEWLKWKASSSSSSSHFINVWKIQWKKYQFTF